MFKATQTSLQTSSRWLRHVMTLIFILSNLGSALLVRAAPVQQDSQPSFPIRAAFYYPWFPESWNQQGFNPFTNYTPSLGFYDDSATVIKQQIAAMQYGGIQAGIASWWGQGSRTDTRIPALLQAAAGTNFRWSIYHENESLGDPSVAELTSDLTYLRDKYGNDPGFLRINGRFVVFVYADDLDACAMADRWKQANTVGAYIVLKVFNGYQNCPSQPDGWHQYSPAVAADSQKGFSYAIAPGFWKKGDVVRLARDLNRWNQNIRDMIASGAPFQLIATFNEWGEGTSVESAQEWATSSGYGAYLDALHNNGVQTQTQPAATQVPPTQTAQPTVTAVPATQTSVPTVAAATQPPLNSGSTAVTTGDPVIAAVGDIACDPASSYFNGGNGTAANCHHKATSDLVYGKNYTAFLALGDTQYENGVLSTYYQSYEPTWGRVKNITYPVAGNHEYHTAGASGYYSYFGAAAGEKTKGYYSFNLGAWHIIALNSNCSQVGGCGVGSPQEQWLKADLAANPNMCTLAFWHAPRFSSGDHGSSTAYDAFWKDLYAAGVELVLNGHDHSYERFAPQNPSGAPDPKGLQEFVIGTGGKNLYGFGTPLANSVARNSSVYGILKVTLRATSYDWQFVPEAGKTWTDSGTRNCFTPSSTQPTPVPVITKTATPIVAPTQTTAPGATATQPAPVAGALTFKPVADAYVDSATPATSYGTATMLRMDGSPVIRSYLKFNIQGLTGTVASAKLKMYANSSSTAGFSVHGVSNTTWQETTVTYSNAPALGTLGPSLGPVTSGTWVTVDVTPLITGNGTFTLALKGNSSTLFSFASRERSTREPQLIITTR